MTEFAHHWGLDPGLDFLNHGSFGACPRRVLAAQAELREEMEADPVAFLGTGFEGRLDEARTELAAFVGAAPDNVAFVPNATSGVNAVLRSLRFGPGDELVVTDHAYNACRAALDWVAGRAGARVVVATVPFPLTDPGEVTNAVIGAVTGRTRLALLDHVTSVTALVAPLEEMVAELHERGVDTLVDGAHAPGMVPVDLDRIGAAYYAGNCHKWLCAPKGAGFLYVRPDRQNGVTPPVISHGANSTRTDRSRFHLLFDWTGTADPTPYLTVPAAIRLMDGLLPGGWPELRAVNRSLALEGRQAICAALGVEAPAPAEMIGSMAAVPLPGGTAAPDDRRRDPLEAELYSRHRIQVPVVAGPSGRSLVRISAQLYNHLDQYRRLGAVLAERLGGSREPGIRPQASQP